MTNRFDDETNRVEGDYYGQYEDDDLDDFIVYSDDDEDMALKKQKLQQQQEEEDDQNEEEEEDGFEEEEEAPVGVQEILSLREQLKEKIRRKNAAMAASACKGSSSVKQQAAPPAKDGFGTFFGPSRQSLAQRVIQEGCSSRMKEIQNARHPRNDASLVSKGQPAGTSRSLPKAKLVTEEKRKADTLRENRDYSSLFSDDAEASPSTKEQTRPALFPKPDVQVRGSKLQPNGQELKGAALSCQSRLRNKAGSPGRFSTADRNGTVAAAGKGSSTAAMKKTTQKLQPSLQSKKPYALLLPGQRQQQQSSRGHKLQPASQSQRLQSNGHHQIQKHASSAQGQRYGQNGSAEPRGSAKPAQKQLAPSSKLKASRPVEKVAAKRKSDNQVDYSLISKEIGAILGYDRSKYYGIDEDDRNMEADYATILKEERRSAKLARKEDEEQLRLIQEEEKRERTKKRKLSGGARTETF